jgi:PAS domain S-box-containing protein
MNRPIKILAVEDNEADLGLVILNLRAGGFEPDWTRVETEEAFLEQLKPDLDLVLSDFNLPSFNGLRALELLKQSGLDIPFILISGTIGEDTAVLVMKNGAADYLMKDRLTRLCSAVSHVIAERRLGRARREVDQTAQRQLAELRVLFDIMPAKIWFKDTGNRILRVNQRVAEDVGRAVAEIEGKPTAEIYPDAAEQFYADDLKVIRSGHAELGVVESIRGRDGEKLWVQTDKVPVRDAEGKVIGVVIMAQDITVRKSADEALRASEERFADAFDNAPISIGLLSTEGRWLKVNHVLCELLGYSEAEMLKFTFADVTHPADLELSREYLERMLLGEFHSYEVEKRYVHRSGKVITTILSKSLVRDQAGKPSYLIAQILDITSRRAAENALAELHQQTAKRERLLNTALASMSDFAQIYDREGRLQFANQPLLKLWGLTLDDVVGKNFFDLGYPDLLARRLQEQIERVFDTKGVIKDESPYTSSSGLKGFYEYIFSPVLAADGAVEFVVGSTRDVTERKRIEESLRLGKSNMAAAQRIAHVGSWELDLVGDGGLDANVLRWSDEMYRIAGLEPGAVDMTSELFFKIVPEEDHEPIRAAVRDAIRDCKTYSIVHRITRPDGEVRVVKETGELSMDEKGLEPRRIVGIAHDITERVRLEEQIRQSQKMDAIGTLAGGIAHDFNNILTAINGYTELAQMKIVGNPEVKGFLDAVLQAGTRATDLVRQILTFSREQPLERRPIKLLPIVAETFKLLRATIPTTVEFRIKLERDAPTVLADASQVHQVLMNLGTNAWHSMRDLPGRLEVTLEKFVVDAGFAATIPQLQPGIYARISVGDTGCGMDQQTLRRIFDPFFTTKSRGEGTGLGLAVVHGIIDNHEGAITVESQPGTGTMFRVYFPAYAGQVASSAAEDEMAPRGNGERVLVVDDEELLAQLGQKALTALGYRAEYVTQPSVALALVRTDPQRFALILTDLTMPGMTGLLLASELQKIRPGLPVILMTGYSASLTPERIAEAGVSQLLIKPPSLYALASAVRTALAGVPAATQVAPPSFAAPSAPCYSGL